MAIILVTGGNRGIGLAIVQVTATRQPSSTIILGCRSVKAGEEAIKSLREQGLACTFDVVQLDIEDDSSIVAAVGAVDKKYGKLDVLINNAASLQLTTSQELPVKRASSNAIFNNCIVSTSLVTEAFIPPLRKSDFPRVIMNSSGRGSIGRTAAGELPKVALVDYCIAKAGLNMLTLHMHIAEEARPDIERITFWAVNPGHTKTAFNGFRGAKDPIVSAEAFVRLLESERGTIAPGTFWEFEEDQFRTVPW